MKVLTQLKLDNSILGVIKQSSIKNTDCLSICAKPCFFRFYYRNDMERNGAITKLCEYQWNLARFEKNHCCDFAENFMHKSLFS